MRDDLLDAQASVKWALAYIPTLQERFRVWQQGQPYRLVVEPDPKAGGQFLVAYPRRPLDPMIYADIGAMLNSMRSALDLLAAVLSKRNGIEPDGATHFPIHRLKAGFLADLRKIKKEKRMSRQEIAKVKRLRPYARGGYSVLPAPSPRHC